LEEIGKMMVQAELKRFRGMMMIKKGLEIIAWLTAILLFVYASHAVVAAGILRGISR
jgi:hypothetical protein